MRPQDVVILLKLLTVKEDDWQYRDLSVQLSMSLSEISDSLKRSQIAQLVDHSRRKVHRQNLTEFITVGLRYVFPVQPGTMVTGLQTAHSHPWFQRQFSSEVPYVWPYENGKTRGLAIAPLYDTVPKACLIDEDLYLLLAAIDVLRVGRVREVKEALKILKEKILP
ncbi:MAG: hypothetical protein ACTHLE_26965 [Agriterribacter sp.]